jgi:hypothetical protein
MPLFAEWDWEFASWVVGGGVVAAIAALTLYFGRKVRAGGGEAEPTASGLLSKFREMHSRGVLSDAEFRRVKTSLSTRLGDELKDNGETGCDD